MEKRESIVENKIMILGFILFSIMAGILFSLFFFDYVGISHSIFVVYLIAGYFLFYGRKNKSFMGYFLLTISLALSISYSIFTNPIFRILNIIVVPISLFSGFLLLTYSNITLELIKFTSFFSNRVIINSFITSLKLPRFVIDLVKYGKKQEDSSAYKSIALGLGISVPVVIFLCIFLAEADGMFSYYLSNLTDCLRFVNINIAMYKLVWTILITFFIFGVYWGLSYESNNDDGRIHSKRTFEPITVTTVLIIVSVLYMVFTKIQLSYLYGNKELPLGFTHAEYARSGFFQLVFLIVLNLMMITILKLKTKTTGKKQNLTLHILYTVITVLTFNMAFSALYKMNLYIAAFGYTRLRLLVQIFTLFLFLVLFLLILFIWKEINLFKPITFAAVLIYVALNFFNIDNYIVQRNIDMYPTISRFDEAYLSMLSLDANSAMKRAIAEHKISTDVYSNWLNNNKNKQEHWYEYNYYSSSVNK
ncbi:DUF4153 domain-containing protein [Clostridium sp. DJ247]|uniref:DUF4153 domain-containing protein n=1 Tax=Clostridium sp. DJ247 TaxID=2726188 RepID=UPI001625D110|nr:DUF4173 domain-containing protein [Clostridium sp. DJ247]MBC2580200.1 DUF4173 domain-containing protein [Clostridium sp. DJ247]